LSGCHAALEVEVSVTVDDGLGLTVVVAVDEDLLVATCVHAHASLVGARVDIVDGRVLRVASAGDDFGVVVSNLPEVVEAVVDATTEAVPAVIAAGGPDPGLGRNVGAVRESWCCQQPAEAGVVVVVLSMRS
jgi:hypothetical protein